MYVELAEPGRAISQGGAFGSIESVKATSDVNSPVSGEIVETNTKLAETPGLVNLRRLLRRRRPGIISHSRLLRR